MCVISCSNDNNDNENEPDSIFTVQQTSSGSHEGYEYVDLGLSVKWAICNVGDSLPYGYGDYYAWGETETKDTFSLEAYHYAGDPNKLPDSCDVARQKMGGNWRMPTEAEFEELLNKCDWRCTYYPKTRIYGYKVTALLQKTKTGCSYHYQDTKSMGTLMIQERLAYSGHRTQIIYILMC